MPKKHQKEIKKWLTILKNNVYINLFCYVLVYPVYISNKKLRNCIDLLLITDDNEWHSVYIKDLNRFMSNRTKKNKNKNHYCRYCLQCFSCEKFLVEHRETFLRINGKKNVKLWSGSITFKNHFKKLPVSFKIYADFESVVVVIEIIIPHILKTIKNTVFAVLPIKSFIKPVVLYRGINAINRRIEAIHKECDFCKKVIKKDFNKNFVMSAEDEERFQSSNKCWVCDNIFFLFLIFIFYLFCKHKYKFTNTSIEI